MSKRYLLSWWTIILFLSASISLLPKEARPADETTKNEIEKRKTLVGLAASSRMRFQDIEWYDDAETIAEKIEVKGFQSQSWNKGDTFFLPRRVPKIQELSELMDRTKADSQSIDMKYRITSLQSGSGAAPVKSATFFISNPLNVVLAYTLEIDETQNEAVLKSLVEKYGEPKSVATNSNKWQDGDLALYHFLFVATNPSMLVYVNFSAFNKHLNSHKSASNEVTIKRTDALKKVFTPSDNSKAGFMGIEWGDTDEQIMTRLKYAVDGSYKNDPAGIYFPEEAETDEFLNQVNGKLGKKNPSIQELVVNLKEAVLPGKVFLVFSKINNSLLCYTVDFDRKLRDDVKKILNDCYGSCTVYEKEVPPDIVIKSIPYYKDESSGKLLTREQFEKSGGNLKYPALCKWGKGEMAIYSFPETPQLLFYINTSSMSNHMDSMTKQGVSGGTSTKF